MIGNLLVAIFLGLVGLSLLTVGYRWFRLLLPIWAFFVGLSAITALVSGIFGQNFFSSAVACVPGLLVGLVFAALSYVWFSVIILMWAGSVGFALAAGLVTALGINGWLIVGLAGIVGAVVFVILASRAELRKFLPILLTSFAGATMVLSAVLVLFGRPVDELNWTTIYGPFGDGGTILAIGIWLVVAAVGVAIQMQVNQRSLAVDMGQYERR